MSDTPSAPGPRDYGVPASGCPMYAATIGVHDLDASVKLYVELLGFDVLDCGSVAGPAFEAHWQLPTGASARMAVLADRASAVGRLALLQFDAANRVRVRDASGQSVYGLVNLNFYTRDIFALTRDLQRAGCEAWSEPLVHDMGTDVGQPIEVMLDGPDSVIINLIQLAADRPDARILRTAAYLADHDGFNRRGSTAVATSAHNVRDYEKALAFYTSVLGMGVRNDVILHGQAMERFTRFPPGARARDTYLQGAHIFGKIALICPLNFPCSDLRPRAMAPNIGYLAQSFIVADLDAALAHATRLGAQICSPAQAIALPALGMVRAAMVRNPGSGALHELIQRLPGIG